ncbi:putative glycosidase C21B10.07 [Psilocybe cubensis]|uniref:Glycosidase C21B10.07 n=2 Tax=Psilocybe cubensis TaxID=181762 RepID=A0ACB8GKI0_PSICU|nr:putative glycosidase C21B10.07 [Psilocybe cubensis]KAH9475564.1 putative glycosidase C21B10.07 [Psilocybe cubensis]
MLTRRKLICTLLLSLAFLNPALAKTYALTDTVVGSSFYNFFEWEAIDDPTHGRVNYVDEQTSRALNLTFASPDSFILRTDFENVLDPNGPGRNSVRIRSVNTYTSHVAVFDVRHMPQGCSTWPAIWETKESDWPVGGEIDIVEGVNDQVPNAATVHTSPGCVMPADRAQTGTSAQLDCNTEVNENAGCSVSFQSPSTPNSYGPPFNANGGGWYAIERSDSFIKIFFWPRNDDSVPREVSTGARRVNPDGWGTPAAFFPSTSSCDLAEHFEENNIIINLTLCGDFAGAVYPASGCPGTCVDFVNNNPSAFQDAFFDFSSIRVYQ